MKKLTALIVLGLFLTAIGGDAYAGWVNGYYRNDGTYVRGHYRSNPDRFKWNNYGPSKNDPELINPYSRDYDRDGIPNYLDMDDDNDGRWDDYDSNQYGR